MSSMSRHPDALFHGRIMPTSSIAFFTSRGGSREYPLCLIRVPVDCAFLAGSANAVLCLCVCVVVA